MALAPQTLTKGLGNPTIAIERIIESLEVEVTHKPRHDTAARRRVVEAMWVDFFTTSEIMREVSRVFGCDIRTVAKDLAWIKEHHRYSMQADKADRESQMRAQWADLRRACVAAGDRRTAAIVNDRLCKMDGLYAPERTEHVSVNVQVNATLDQVLDAFKSKEDLDAFMRVIDAVEAAQITPAPKPLTTASDNDTDVVDADLER